VVEDSDNRRLPAVNACPTPVMKLRLSTEYAPPAGSVGNVADVVLMAADIEEIVVDPAGEKPTSPHTSQSPAVREMDVTFAGVLDVSEIALPDATSD